MPGVSPEELQEIAPPQTAHARRFPWRIALHSPSVLSLLVTAFCYVYAYTFFQTWFHTFLVKGRGFSEGSLVLSTLPYIIAAFANLAGGAASDALVRRFGLKWGRRAIGIAGLGCAALFTLAAMITRRPILTLVLLTVVYGGITFQQSGVFGVCLDIGHEHAGAMVGLMNTSSQFGGLLSSVAYGYIVSRFGSYDAPFVPMAALLFLGAMLWFKVDASEKLTATLEALPAPLGA
jgi:predicted MFS family arabinose efflux permease